MVQQRQYGGPSGGSQQQLMQQGLQGLARPLPPQQQGSGWQQSDGRRTAGVQARTYFKEAEQVLGHKCPAGLHGHMLPVGMKFFTARKLLDDPVKVRDVNRPFTFKCKVCDKVGHEAFECDESFMVEGKPGKSYRELLRMGIVDRHGQYN